MKKNGMKHTAAFKAKVAIAAIREQETVSAISRHHKIHANQVYKWKKQAVDRMSELFETQSREADGTERESELLKKIGELTVERDFLSQGLGRFR